MKKLLLLIVICLFLVGCDETPIATQQSNNPNMRISVLFEYDGVRVYRFYDGGYKRYFAKVIGTDEVKTMSSVYINQGKTGYYRHEDVQTVRGE